MEKNKGGRPSKKKTIDLEVLALLCERGFTDKEISKVLGICEKTLNNYKKDPKFLQPLKDGKRIADERVVKALYESALGYRTKYQKNMVVSDGKDCGSHIEQVEEEVVFAPNSTSIIFWLKNRDPANWRDKREVEHSGDVGLKINELCKKASEELDLGE